MKYIQIYGLFLLLVCNTSCGQNTTNIPQDDIAKKHNGISESQLNELDTSKVPIGQVRNIKQARNGDILIAAGWSGVFRYDGKSFVHLTSSIIGSPRFWDVLEDRHGNLWFSSLDSAVYKYDGKTFKHITTREGLVDNRVTAVYENRAGIIWFGTQGGISHYDGKTFQNFTKTEGLSHNDLTTILEDKNGKLWIGTRGEACFYDGKTFTVLKNKDGKTFKNVWSIIEDRKGSIWFADLVGLWRYDGGTFTKVSQRGAYAIIEDKKGNIWTTGSIDPNGRVWALSRYDAKSLDDKMPTVTEIKTGVIMDFLAILEANDGSIWYGGGRGVCRYDGKTITDF